MDTEISNKVFGMNSNCGMTRRISNEETDTTAQT